MRRVVGIAVLCLVALLVYRRCDRSDRGTREVRAPVAVTPGAKRVDPKTLASIAGTVIDEAKQPIAGAFVCVGLAEGRTCARSGADGSYALAAVPPGTHTIVASAKAYRPARREVVLGVQAHVTGADIELRRGGLEVTGTVVDINGGPIANAQVFTSTATTETASDGTFALWVALRDSAIWARAEGYAPGFDSLHAPARVELVLLPASAITGTVVDAVTGAPVAGAAVVTRDGPGGRQPAISDEHGTFVVGALPPDRYDLEARTDHGFGMATRSVLVGVGTTVDGVVIRLYPAARITARVNVSTTGEPCPNASVFLVDRERDRSLFVEPTGGAHVARGVLPGTYHVEVTCDGYLERDEREPLVVGARDLEIERVVEPAAQITGTIRDETGQPLDGVSVAGSAPSESGRSYDETGADGRYMLAGLPPGEIGVYVRAGRGLEPDLVETFTLTARATIERDFVVQRRGEVRGTVVDGRGRGVPGLFVMLLQKDEDFAPLNARSDADGAFVIRQVAPGDYTVSAARTEAYQSADARAQISVGARATTTVKLVLPEPVGTIRGTVRDATGRVIDDAFVEAISERIAPADRRDYFRRDDYIENRSVVTNAEGAFALEDLPVGTYTVRAWRRGGASAITEHVATGTTTVVKLPPSGSIAGTVRSTSFDELSIEITDGAQLRRRERLFRSGAFVIDNLPAGRLTISAGAAGREAHVAVDLREGEHRTGVVIDLAPLVTLTGRVVDHRTRQPAANIYVHVRPAVGYTTRFSLTDAAGKSYVTDAAGRFTVKNAPSGTIVMTLSGYDSNAGDTTIRRTVAGAGVVDLGDVPIIDPRTTLDAPRGVTGLEIDRATEAGVPVSEVTPGGPAARAGIRVGDIIVAIDGFDTRAEGAANIYSAFAVPAGTKVAVTLARGVTVDVVLAPRR